MSPDALSLYLLMAIMSMAVCMAIIPVMMRLAPYIGMVDRPDGRKVHTAAIPRSGGIGIVLGVLTPLLIWMNLSDFTLSFIAGCLVLLVFGAWDDARNIRPAFKFFGQLLAAVIVVYYGGLYVQYFPFLGTEILPAYIGQPFTVIAIVGMVNALNLSDGLDGLAGGEALISLAAIAYLAYRFEGAIALVVAAVTIGGIFGFLRFNSHPARIFMGDSGSQTLGFILAVLVVYLTQEVNHLVSPVIALFLLGLPVVDSLVVFYMRARRGDSLVVAAKDHLHHRLLNLGFYHYESVIIIYSIQMIFVANAVLFPYESDWFLLALYACIGVVVYGMVFLGELSGWRFHSEKKIQGVYLSSIILDSPFFSKLPFRVMGLLIAVILLSAAFISETVPADIAMSSGIVAVGLALVYFLRHGQEIVRRLLMYIVMATAAYLITFYPPEWLYDTVYVAYIFYGALLLAMFAAIRLSKDAGFSVSPLDYLVITVAIIVIMLPSGGATDSRLIWLAVQVILLFYVVEILLQQNYVKQGLLQLVVFTSLVILTARGVVWH